MTALLLPATRIGRLRIRAPGADPQALANRCALALRSLDLEPAGLPPQAILCVRALADPLPGHLDDERPRGHSRPLAWQAAMRAALRETLQRAARPAREPVPGNVDAVLFADVAELLACAARDACRGSLSSSWWWQHLMPGPFDRVVDAWRRAPEYVPAAFDALVASGDATAFVRRLSPKAATAVLDAVLRAHALPELADDIAAALAMAPGDVTLVNHRRISPVVAVPFAPSSAGRQPPQSPWRHVWPAVLEEQAPALEQRALAALLVVLRRSPSLARSAAFAADVIRYLQKLREAPTAQRGASDPMGTPPTATVTASAATVGTEPPKGARPVAPRDDHQLTDSDESDGTERDPIQRSRVSRPPPPHTRTLGPHVERSAREAETATVVKAPAPSPAVHSRDQDPREPQALPCDTATETPHTAEDAAESALAGTFFLLNVAMNLELYSDGLYGRKEIALGIWDFVGLVARRFSTRDDADDALWPILREFAGSTRVRYPRAMRNALLAQVHAHLAELLDVRHPERFLIARRGSISRTPGHVDVHFSLERHPLEIRMARLDRNPGWIPAAGVHVAFHFD